MDVILSLVLVNSSDWREATSGLKMLKTIGQALFSTGLQYPKHSNLESKGEDYEVRTYEVTNWVSTTLTGMELDPAMNAGFRRLFKYIQGENERKEKVEMTAPVTCRVEPGAGPACETTFTVSFFIPEQNQADPPKPTNPEVFIENRPEFTAFVRTYGGFTNEQTHTHTHTHTHIYIYAL
ncbi:heme-binding protein 2-like isoform X3 [Clupea harengus]|uniref:Heme-binding protein 2-like isoform X3 n=1 Tax=Clupea harengus TaxID=7950 RepID=A0A6P8GRJ1_CLUHA|nr:heme-binding protein 2-like isoform X3 [Clupea harengus]